MYAIRAGKVLTVRSRNATTATTTENVTLTPASASATLATSAKIAKSTPAPTIARTMGCVKISSVYVTRGGKESTAVYKNARKYA